MSVLARYLWFGTWMIPFVSTLHLCRRWVCVLYYVHKSARSPSCDVCKRMYMCMYSSARTLCGHADSSVQRGTPDTRGEGNSVCVHMHGKSVDATHPSHTRCTRSPGEVLYMLIMCVSEEGHLMLQATVCQRVKSSKVWCRCSVLTRVVFIVHQ
jgi:hypothetical protein